MGETEPTERSKHDGRSGKQRIRDYAQRVRADRGRGRAGYDHAGLGSGAEGGGGGRGGERGRGRDELARVAIIGSGSQGRNLLLNCLKIPGIRFVAVCDIWPYSRRYAINTLKKYDQVVNGYEDYREMLDKEKHLDAVIVATPDWMHAEHTIACLKAGKHVYCEKEMANTTQSAQEMVRAMRETGKLLQIGHQRRSNPRYWHALKMIEKDKILGRVTHCYGQWNRPRLYEIGCPKGEELDAEAAQTLWI